MPRTVNATCRKCGETFALNIGENTLDEAMEMLKQRKGFECTAGHHIELGSPMDYWTIRETITNLTHNIEQNAKTRRIIYAD